MSALFYYKKLSITSSDLAYLHIKDKISKETEETWVTCLNSSKKIIKSQCIFKGSVDFCPIHPREVFKFVITNNASSFILFHSHPSNQIEPSKSDQRVTYEFYKASKILKIDFIDHIIVADSGYYSFFDNNSLNSKTTKNSKKLS